jgi:malate dehydrogenase (oxaloacetate-decarboxylating)(NADP+)
MSKILKQDALKYHNEKRPGKIEVIPTKPHSSQHDLSLAYSPGVAEPCLQIAENKEDVYKYTIKGNLVAVISNGTAVLGLGDIGAHASKPVMEGKGLLFKIFADIDVFDIEVDTTDVDEFVRTVKAISPTFGGINLEDIKAPQCFEIEERLKAELDIPVMHDDQHGTAIISAAGLVNAVELAGKKLDEIILVVNGAGAAAVACSKLYIALGVKKENIVMCDSKGVIHSGRTDLNKYKKEFVTDRKIKTLAEAMKNADVFVGLSVADVVTSEMLLSMAKNPIVFALANPNPEISYDKAITTREDVIFATGRSDYPNQINNVLGFPFIFRGALDVRATCINEAMKMAAVQAVAKLAREIVPESVNMAYNATNIQFGREYIIPKPLDHRLIAAVAPAVAKAAIESGVAKHIITNWESYAEELILRTGHDNKILRQITNKAKRNPKTVVFAEADHYNVLKAAYLSEKEGFARPILLGNLEKIEAMIKEYDLDFKDAHILNPRCERQKERLQRYAKILFEKRQRRGLNLRNAKELLKSRNYFGMMMVETGEADTFISGYAHSYKETIHPAIEIIGCRENLNRLAGMNILITKKGPLFFADTTLNNQPDVKTLKSITLLTAEAIKNFNIEPVIAMVSYSNFGSAKGESPSKLHEVVKELHKEFPELMVDGEVQFNFAVNPEMYAKIAPFSKIVGKQVNTFIFPNLTSGNSAYKIMQELAGAESIGPILIGAKKPIHIVQLESSVREIVNMVAYAVVDAQ